MLMRQDLSDTVIYQMDSPLLTVPMLSKSLHIPESTASTVLTTLLDRDEVSEVEPGVFLRSTRRPMVSMADPDWQEKWPVAPAASDGLWSDPDDLMLSEPMMPSRIPGAIRWHVVAAAAGGFLTAAFLFSSAYLLHAIA